MIAEAMSTLYSFTPVVELTILFRATVTGCEPPRGGRASDAAGRGPAKQAGFSADRRDTDSHRGAGDRAEPHRVHTPAGGRCFGAGL